ncbi:MAG TPA: hypothetical protein VJV78_08060 [Polyangiales bacterium]|nr:hypothetical protein [Polyangiales bacterium]
MLSSLGGCGKEAHGSDKPKPSTPARSRDATVLARAAVVIGSCVPDHGINRDLSHLWSQGEHWWQRLAYAAECIAAAGGGCDALKVCIGWSLVPSSERCTTCEGNVAIRCGDGARLTLDCASLGLRCDESAVCRAATSRDCDPASFKPRCAEDGVPEYCASGVVYRGTDCRESGLGCVDTDCAGRGEPCSPSWGASNGDMHWLGTGCADDSTLEACVGGRSARRSCSDEGPGFTCQSLQDTYFCGLASECLPGELPREDARGTAIACEGDTIVFCNAGRIERLSCTDLGFDGCNPKTNGCFPAIAEALAPE